MALIIPIDFKFKPPNLLQHRSFHTHVEIHNFRTKRSINCKIPHAVRSPFSAKPLDNFYLCEYSLNPRFCYRNSVLTTRASNADGSTPSQPSTSDINALQNSPSTGGDDYVALFVRMLGIDKDPLDREQAIVALWKYSLGGKPSIDNIMQFHGAVNLTVNLLKSNSDSACEAAAGVLRMISSINMYRNTVAESGAVEEITGLLRRTFLSSNVKEQSLCTLWNLSVDENLRMKMANVELLPLLLKFLEDEDVKVKEAAGGVLANLALSHLHHRIMVEAGVIPKLAKLLKPDVEGSKIIRKEAKNALLEIAKDDYYKILVLEEGLVLVPLIGAAAYRSFKPVVHSWPSLPDGTNIEQNPKVSSRYGASELLLGLNIDDQNGCLEEAKMNAIVGRTQQQFLARVGAIEVEDEDKSNSESSSSQRFTILPWIDGVARLVLILGLEDESAIARAADAIADSSISEHMRVSFKEAGALQHLIQLIHHPNDGVKLAVLGALEKLSISNNVCQKMEAEGALSPLINLMMQLETYGSLNEKILNILTRILDPSKEMKSKLYDGPVNGSNRGWDGTRNSASTGHLNEMAESKSTDSLQTIDAGDLLNPVFLARLVEILKTSSPNSQRKAASILEFIASHELSMEKIVTVDIASGLDAVFQQEALDVAEMESDNNGRSPELLAVEVEEVGHAISAASRLLTRLLDFQKFRQSIDSHHFTKLLRKILMSNIPLHNKDWVAACLVKLSSLSGPNIDLGNPINMEVTLYETIPRLIEQIETSLSPEVHEAAVIELNRIISEGVVDSTRAVAAEGGIFPLVKLIESGSDRAIEAGLAILYNLSMDSENHAAILAAGAVPILRRIVLSQKSQWMRALHLLRTLPT